MGLLSKFGKKQKSRSLVIGLDGVPFSLLNDLSKKNIIPNMTSIFSNGYFGEMSVCIPEISSVSWSSFMTGTQSGNHGIYGFLDLEPNSYNIYFPNFAHLKASTIWDDLARDNKKSVIINMPSTYPAKEINGALVSGFVAVDINKAVYPITYLNQLNKLGYKIDIDLMKARSDHDFLFHDLDITLNTRQAAVDYFWDEIDWDLYMAVVTGTDRLMHFKWNAFEDENDPYHSDFLEYYKKVDRFVGRLYDRFMSLKGSEDGYNHFYMLSDHGFAGIKSEVYLNRWLQDNNYLSFQHDTPKSISEISSDSKAFAMDPSRIYINLKDKYPAGNVSQNDYNGICSELKQALESLTSPDNEKVVKKVYGKDELYEGNYTAMAPDLVVLAHKGFDLKGKVGVENVFDRTDLVGMHGQDNAFFYSSNSIECKTIFEIKKVILEQYKKK